VGHDRGNKPDVRRIRHAFLIICGRVSRASLARLEFEMAFEKSTADLAQLQALATAVVGELQTAQSDRDTARQAASDATAAAQQAQAALDAGDTDLSSQIQQIISILQPVVPQGA
jgi:hypothetical protein